MVKFTQNEKAALHRAIAQEKINHDFARVLAHKIKLMSEEETAYSEIAQRDWEREIYKQCDEEDRKELK